MGQPSWTIVFGASSTGKVRFMSSEIECYVSGLIDPYLPPSMGDSRPRFYDMYSQILAIMYYISTFGSLVLLIWPVSKRAYG